MGSSAPAIDLLPLCFDQPGFVSANIERLRAALLQVPDAERAQVPLFFTAHSIPLAAAASSPYEAQLRSTCERVASAVSRSDWTLAYHAFVDENARELRERKLAPEDAQRLTSWLSGLDAVS